MKAVPALLALLCVVPVWAKEKPGPKDPKVVLETFRINTDPISSFAFDLRIYSDPKTKKVTRMFVGRVQSDTDAERLGLRENDEIIKVDGMEVKGMEARLSQGSQLGALFLNREPGEPLNLEVITTRTVKLTVRAQKIHPGSLPP